LHAGGFRAPHFRRGVPPGLRARASAHFRFFQSARRFGDRFDRRRYYPNFGWGPVDDAAAGGPSGYGASPIADQSPAADEQLYGYGRVDEHGLPYNSQPGICFWQRKADEFVRLCK
jgi:hypothetical protein